MKKIIVYFLFLTSARFSLAQEYLPDWNSLDARPIPEWFTKAKFGIFIHWGLYSVPSWATNSYADGFGSNYAEWYWQRLNATNLKIHKEFVEFHERVYGKNFKYPDFAPLFKCELFDPRQWADIFKNAGARYVVLTSKHHDGFTLWPSAESWNWNSVDIGPHRDLAGELSTAVKDAGLHMGFYYSLYEWYNPIYNTDVNKYVNNRMLPQLKDLVTRYNPEVIWSDGDWDHSDTVWRSKEFLTWLYNKSAVKNTVVVNDRWGAGKHGGFNSTEYGKGNSSLQRPWEETRGIGESFGYNRNESLTQYMSSEKLVHMLIEIVAKGGNLLLNIGPAADGSIPVIMQQRLKDIGDWLKVNGEAIYETTAWKEAPEKNQDNIFFTRKGNDLYVIVTKWKNEIEIKNIGNVQDVSMPGYNHKIKFRARGNKVVITAPLLNPGNMPCQFAWVYKLKEAF
ncbi:MAG: alpha-L-fucosidase [Bacteroidetes bacterium]|nr:alpha-L-fucosidase [Bacteroidota bacterium]